ncbi:hypothetical protein MMC13_006344 [Lambiella insularis]|nr:hypothetical protein [Lambiella insularis]
MSTLGYTVAPNGTNITSLGWMLEPNGTYGRIADDNACLSPPLSSDTLANLRQCTLTTCTLAQAHFDYVPTLAGNTLYTAIFGLAFAGQLFLGIRYKTWGFMGAMFGGLVLEIVGYVSRIQMSSNPFTSNPFLIYLICLTIGPAFFSAAVYLCLARIVVVYGTRIARFSPRTYTTVFICCDFLALVLQGAGGGIADTANDYSTTQLGINVMIAGLGWQVASLCLFIVACGDLAWRIRQRSAEVDHKTTTLRTSFKFKAFLCALGVATLTIFIRSCFRVAELSQGFHGPLANQEITFMVLEGAMIVIAITALTTFHPGVCFEGYWAAADFGLKGRKKQRANVDGEKEVMDDEAGVAMD